MTQRFNWLTLLFTIGLLAVVLACRPSASPPPPQARTLAAGSWDSVLAQARGTTVVWRMWRGDPAINAYVDGWVAPRMRGEYGIDVEAVDGYGPELVNVLATEREAMAGRLGTTSLVWINGETFAQLRSESLLDGPWAHSLPNANLVDTSSSIVSRDFEQDPAGYESPWGMVTIGSISGVPKQHQGRSQTCLHPRDGDQPARHGDD